MQSSPAAAADDEPAARGTLSRTVVRRVRGGSAAVAALLGAVAGCLLALATVGLDGWRAVVGGLALPAAAAEEDATPRRAQLG